MLLKLQFVQNVKSLLFPNSVQIRISWVLVLVRAAEDAG